MFEITLNDAKTVKGIFEAISAVVGESKMSFTPDGITMNAIDDGRICLVGLELSKDDFDAYKCEDSYDLGLNIEDMVKILKRSSSSDSITFKYKPKSKKIQISMKDLSSKKSRHFSLQLIDLGDSGIKPEALENIEYQATATIPISYLEEAIKDADIFSETLQFKMSGSGGIEFKSEGQIGATETQLAKDDDSIQNFSVEDEAEGTFALQYLKNIIKINAIADLVNLSLNSNTPVKAKFNVLSSSNFTYYLAPRIEEEEEDYDENY